MFLAGFTNDHRAATLGAWLDSNPYGLPMVIAARKGFPNFNEFTLRTDVLVQRKLQLTRASNAPGIRPNGTNQMYVLSLSNYFGLEAWYPYETGPMFYPRPLTLTVSNWTTLLLTNALGTQTGTVTTVGVATNLPAGTWRSGLDVGFILPLSSNQVFLSNAVYRFNDNTFANSGTNNFEGLSGYPIPDWFYVLSNRLTYVLTDGERVVDFVLLDTTQGLDLRHDLIEAYPYSGIGGISAAVANLWNTNRLYGPAAPTDGIREQINISLGNIPTANAEWRSFALTATPGENDKNRAIDAFRHFNGLSPSFGTTFSTNTSLAMVAPFNPAAKMTVLATWQANDPLVHTHRDDLGFPAGINNWQYLKPSQPATNLFPSSLGRLNDRFSPWGGNPLKVSDPAPYDGRVKDPGVYSPDYWNFPTNAPWAVAWLGRVHRGTPWQTIYLKADAASLVIWTNQSMDVVIRPPGQTYSRTHPTNDWRLAALLASLLNTNDFRTLTSINTTNVSEWTATLTGLTVLSNTTTVPILGQPPQFQTIVIASDAPQIATLIDGIERLRAAPRGQYFPEVSDFLAVPEMSSASPWLNQTGYQIKFVLTDEAYEILPSQLLARVRPDPVGTAVRTGDAIALRFTVWDGPAYRVESSADFQLWTLVSEPHHGTNGAFTLSVPASTGPQFFRAVLRP